ncbi:MAG: 16S rRNA (guanine(527)-N(7))-methyltransferase RsmG [Peptococcaceae bacterium MAG4]|nr:16S rRNA (guanine(527)-N(7))-methyltransferase RsmG [Peptococcaceae bacterium MAG4]
MGNLARRREAMSILLDTLVQGALKMGLELSQEQVGLFKEYYRFLAEANKSINLTSILDEKDVAVKHFLDSLSCFNVIALEDGMSLIDIGTGAGFPGVPIKIYRPGLKVTLLESVEKKVRFLEGLISSLGLRDIEVVHARAEDFGRDPAQREKWDRVVSRAVASLAVLAEYCLPFLKVEGYFVAMKGPKLEEELKKAGNALLLLGGRVDKIMGLKLPFTGEERKLVLIRKTGPTPGKYPRRAGIPQKRPL